jgi:MoxR-like ATPase
MIEFQGIDHLQEKLSEAGYISDASINMSLFLCHKMERPLLIEGPPGVGKTEIAKVLSRIHQTELIRLQCYEGLSADQAIYEWNYQKQLISLKMMEVEKMTLDEKESIIYQDDYLLKRPLLESISQPIPPVLLIDEVDRSDEEFESYLLEILSDWQISIPEIGTVKAKSKPIVIITSNRQRELSDALRRRCFYIWIDYPDFDKELNIVRRKVPEIDTQLGVQICRFMQELRLLKIEKVPGIAETLDWAQSLAALHIDHLTPEIVESTLGIVLKDWKDIRETSLTLSELLEKTGVIQKIK